MNNNVLDIITDTLYDKIIDVELQRTEADTQIKTVISTMRDTLDAGDIKQTVKARTGLPIAIYAGDTHFEYVKGAGGIVNKVQVKASGITLAFTGDPDQWWKDSDFLDKIDLALQKMNADKQAILDPSKAVPQYSAYEIRTGQNYGGARSRTDTFKGCRLQFQYDGKIEKYHAVYLQSDDVSTSTYHVVQTTKIACNKGGLKPSIAFTTNVIPGNFCYKLILKITNLNLDYDIRSVKRVKVTAGYRTQGLQQIFNCPVFSSYIESPNPDGVTVFECLCVGTTDTVSENRPIHFIYHGGKVTIKEFVESIGRGLEVPVYNYLLNPSKRKVVREGKEEEIEDPGYNGLEVNISGTNIEGKETYAENAAATLTWARQIIQKRIAAAEGFTQKPTVGSKVPYPYIRMELTSDGLIVYALNKPNSDSNDIIDEKRRALHVTKDVVILDAVKGATFNGVALTVKALWNPKVRPGSIFQMEANIFNGSSLPNVISDKQYGKDADKHYYYRCITNAISFSTNGNENEMSVLAIPIRYMEEENPIDEKSIKSWDDFIAVSQETFDINGARVINFGSPDKKQIDETPVAKNKQTVKDATNNMFNLDILNYFPNTVDYVIQEGDNLSTLAQYFFLQGRSYCDFDIVPEHPEDLPQGVWEGEMDDRAFMWPLIAVLTYRKRLRLEQVKASSNGYETMEHMMNPNMIHTGRILVIPVIPNFNTLKYVQNIFKYALGAWEKNFPEYGNWAREWKTIYQYLGGTLDGN